MWARAPRDPHVSSQEERRIGYREGLRRKKRGDEDGREYTRKRKAHYELTLVWDHSRGSQTQTILFPAHITWTYAKQTINHQGTEEDFCCKAAC